MTTRASGSCHHGDPPRTCLREKRAACRVHPKPCAGRLWRGTPHTEARPRLPSPSLAGGGHRPRPAHGRRGKRGLSHTPLHSSPVGTCSVEGARGSGCRAWSAQIRGKKRQDELPAGPTLGLNANSQGCVRKVSREKALCRGEVVGPANKGWAWPGRARPEPARTCPPAAQSCQLSHRGAELAVGGMLRGGRPFEREQ